MPYVQIGDTVQPNDLGPTDPKGLIDAANDTLEDLESNAADPDEVPDPVTYTYELQEEPLTIASSQGEGLDFTVDQTWAYPVFTRADGSTDAVLDAINANLKQSYDDDLEAAQSWTMDTGFDQVWLHRDEVTWMDGSVVCIRGDRSTFAGGAHGFESSTAAFVDLASGQTFDVTQACGISLLDLETEATSAIETYIAQTGLDPSFSADGVANIVSDLSRYYATSQGTAICVWPYEIGSYADGQHFIYVHAFADPAIVGTSAQK